MTVAGKTVLVTGADGFIGSHLVERLVADGAKVRAFCLYNSFGSAGWLDLIPDRTRREIDVRLGDVRDLRLVESAVAGVDIVLHLAALIAIPYSYSAVASFVETNVLGTMNVLDATMRAATQRVVIASTSEVYGTPETLPIKETHPLRAQSPYAATKIAADQLALAYHRSYGIPVSVVRPFNTYGPRQSDRAVIATIIAQLLSGTTEVRLGRLDTRRDFTFVSDTVDGFVRASTATSIEGSVIQLGTGRAETIGAIFEQLCHLTGVNAAASVDEARMRPDASEVLVLQSDPRVAAEKLGWHAETSLEDGLKATVDWAKAHIG